MYLETKKVKNEIVCFPIVTTSESIVINVQLQLSRTMLFFWSLCDVRNSEINMTFWHHRFHLCNVLQTPPSYTSTIQNNSINDRNEQKHFYHENEEKFDNLKTCLYKCAKVLQFYQAGPVYTKEYSFTRYWSCCTVTLPTFGQLLSTALNEVVYSFYI